MKCPKCESDLISHPMFAECASCGHEWSCLHPAVKRAFAACKRALNVAERIHPSLWESDLVRARNALARAEGKGEKKP